MDLNIIFSSERNIYFCIMGPLSKRDRPLIKPDVFTEGLSRLLSGTMRTPNAHLGIICIDRGQNGNEK